GALSGNGGLIVTDSGTLELSGANTYTGDTVVNTGSTLKLDVTGSDTTTLRLANSATLNLNFSGNYAVTAFYTNGVALRVGTYNNGNLPAFIIGSGNLVVASGISSGLWTGLGANNNWSTAGNWNNNAVPIFPIALTFAGSTRLANNNDLSNITAASITFDAAAGAFALGGNGIALNGNLGFNGNPAAPVTQAVNLNMAWNADETIDTPTNGNLTLGGAITSGNNLFKLDAGTLTLGGVNTIESMDINGGTNIITGNTTINGNGVGYNRLYVGDGDAVAGCFGTLVIQPGAVLDVTGNFNDTFVIGRDNASGGRIIQNGGTFTFNPSNNHNMVLGATSNPNLRSEYDMNGGLLDMSGGQLSVGWAPQTGSIGFVNQIGGVITNVNEICIPFLNAGSDNGLGVYTLSGGSVYLLGGGIVNNGPNYTINLGGGTVGAETSWSSSLNMNLTGSNGPVTLNPAGNTITLSGGLSGSGGLTVAGGGTLDLSGANSYTGNTTVNTGSTLELDQTGSNPGTFNLANDAVLDLTFGGTYVVGGCRTNGVALAGGVYTSSNLPGFITGTGSLTVPAATPPVVNRPIVSGGNLVLTGSGGTGGAHYTWLTSTNVTTPIALWVTNTTGNFDGSGDFSNAIPISISTPTKVFLLRTP
ncbi:MAG TPA: autotransporter-associated beta strand repeat-containing protein, partial [Candidatus Angelobacter sp.]|nr:autotransporter-associated beta strand repeat-containing protein [Candidatus Angelobacter sp.]